MNTTTPRRRIIRKVPLISRIKSYPYDLVLSWNESFQLVDWDALADEYSTYTLLVLNLLIVLSKAYINQYSTPSYKTLKIHTSLSSALFFAKVVFYLLGSFSFISFFWCLTTFKNYDLITRDINQIPNTSSLFKIEIDRPVELDEQSSHLSIRILKYFYKKLYHRVFPKEDVKEKHKKLTWRLIVWTPSSFQLHLTALFSPLNVLFVYLISPIGFSNLLFLSILSAFEYFIIIFKYETKLKDQFILHQNYLQEYDEKFVNPRLNKRYVDKSVDGWNNGTVRLFYPEKRTKQFITHGL